MESLKCLKGNNYRTGMINVDLQKKNMFLL